MDIKKINEIVNELLKMPETKEEAIKRVKQSPNLKAMAEELAFRQAVVNVLILSGVVSENDLNASLKHFEEQIYEQFAEELLDMIDEAKKEQDAFTNFALNDLDDSDDDLPAAKA